MADKFEIPSDIFTTILQNSLKWYVEIDVKSHFQFTLYILDILGNEIPISNSNDSENAL
jgi:hypothetical protein